MTASRDQRTTMELTTLSPAVRAVLESIMADGDVTLVRGGEPVGTVTFQPEVLEGVVLPAVAQAGPDPVEEHHPGVQVVVTTMRMSEAARARLSASFGPSYVVVDLADAPPTADVVLTNPVSHQLVGQLTMMFPRARVLVTEIHDDELGLDVRGPVGRLLDAGAAAYLPRRPVEQLARDVHGYLLSRDRLALDAREEPVLELDRSGIEKHG